MKKMFSSLTSTTVISSLLAGTVLTIIMAIVSCDCTRYEMGKSINLFGDVICSTDASKAFSGVPFPVVERTPENDFGGMGGLFMFEYNIQINLYGFVADAIIWSVVFSPVAFLVVSNKKLRKMK